MMRLPRSSCQLRLTARNDHKGKSYTDMSLFDRELSKISELKKGSCWACPDFSDSDSEVI